MAQAPARPVGARLKTGLKHRGWLGFEEFGSFAGPPGRPEASEVDATTLLLRWEAPQHLGGSGVEVLGYHVLVQYAGEGGFSVHVVDTASSQPQCVMEELAPDSWHEFRVVAITSAGLGAPSLPSRPVLTNRAPHLLRSLRSSTQQLATLRGRLERKRNELLALARSGTVALRAAPADEIASMGSGCVRATASTLSAFPPHATGGAGDTAGGDDDAGLAARRCGATLSASEARDAVRERVRLERQVEALERRVAEHELTHSHLVDEQAHQDERRREELDDVAERSLEEAAQATEGAVGGLATGGLAAAGYGAPGEAGGWATPEPFGTPAEARRTPYSSNRADGQAGGWAAALGGVHAKPTPQGRRRNVNEERRRLQAIEAYARLVLEQEAAAVTMVYAPFAREAVRAQMRRALSNHVLTGRAAEDEVGHYFDVALNRVRSAATHNVFDRFADWELEQLLLLFARFDTDHDGVLEFRDFCKLMLLVADRVSTVYHQKQLLRMFAKVDLNGDGLIDLNEFLWMQVQAQQGSGGPVGGGSAVGLASDGAGVHPRPGLALATHSHT